jgi:hypothetical protein
MKSRVGIRALKKRSLSLSFKFGFLLNLLLENKRCSRLRLNNNIIIILSLAICYCLNVIFREFLKCRVDKNVVTSVWIVE